MQTLFYSIADFIFSLQIPFALNISKESIPFLVFEADRIDERIVFKITDSLPECVSEGGYWCESHYYINIDGQYTVYYCEPGTLIPYLSIVYDKECCTRILYASTLAHFSYTSTYMLRLIGLERMLLRHECLMFHAAVVAWEKHGILFSGPSGVGKSTQAELWKLYKHAEILNGDRAGIRKKDGKWRAYGLPYAGSSYIYRNESVEISALIFLQQGTQNILRKLNSVESIRQIMNECFIHHWDAHFMNRALKIITELVLDIPVYMLQCRPDWDAVELVCDLLKDKEN